MFNHFASVQSFRQWSIISPNDSHNCIFRSLCLAEFEIYFGRSLKLKADGTYEVVKTGGRIIRDRFVNSERLLLLLHPEYHDFQFKPVFETIADCEQLLEYNSDDDEIVDKDDKLNFLKGLRAIIKSFQEEEPDQRNLAMEDFKTLVASQVDEGKRYYIGYLMDQFFFKNINFGILENYKKLSNCWSKVMRNSDCVSFWNDTESLANDGLGDNVEMIKSVISRFLGKDLNQ